MTPLRRALALALCLALALPAAGFAATAKAKKKKKKKKTDQYASSEYKSYNVLVDHDSPTYRFDANGNPIPPAGSKKKRAKKKKKYSSDAGDDASAKADCNAQDSCSEGAPQP